MIVRDQVSLTPLPPRRGSTPLKELPQDNLLEVADQIGDPVSARLARLELHAQGGPFFSRALRSEGSLAGAISMLENSAAWYPDQITPERLTETLQVALPVLEARGPAEGGLAALTRLVQSFQREGAEELSRQPLSLLNKWWKEERITVTRGQDPIVFGQVDLAPALAGAPCPVQGLRLDLQPFEQPPILSPLAWAGAEEFLNDQSDRLPPESVPAVAHRLRIEPDWAKLRRVGAAFGEQGSVFEPHLDQFKSLASYFASRGWPDDSDRLAGELYSYYENLTEAFPNAVDRELVTNELVPLAQVPTFSRPSYALYQRVFQEEIFDELIDPILKQQDLGRLGENELWPLGWATKEGWIPNERQARQLASWLLRGPQELMTDKRITTALLALDKVPAETLEQIDFPDTAGKRVPFPEALFDRYLNEKDGSRLLFLTQNDPAAEAFFRMAHFDTDKLETVVRSAQERSQWLDNFEPAEGNAVAMLVKVAPDRVPGMLDQELRREQDYFAELDMLNPFRGQAIERIGTELPTTEDDAFLRKTLDGLVMAGIMGRREGGRAAAELLALAQPRLSERPELGPELVKALELDGREFTPFQRAVITLAGHLAENDSQTDEELFKKLRPHALQLGRGCAFDVMEGVRNRLLAEQRESLSRPGPLKEKLETFTLANKVAERTSGVDRGDNWKTMAAAFHHDWGSRPPGDWHRSLAERLDPAQTLSVARYIERDLSEEKMEELWEGFETLLDIYGADGLHKMAGAFDSYRKSREAGMAHENALRSLVEGRDVVEPLDITFEEDEILVGDIALDIQL